MRFLNDFIVFALTVIHEFYFNSGWLCSRKRSPANVCVAAPRLIGRASFLVSGLAYGCKILTDWCLDWFRYLKICIKFHLKLPFSKDKGLSSLICSSQVRTTTVLLSLRFSVLSRVTRWPKIRTALLIPGECSPVSHIISHNDPEHFLHADFVCLASLLIGIS